MLGKTVSDKLTGFTGTVTGDVKYLTGCNQMLVQPKVKDGGDFVEPRWFDVDRLQVLEHPTVTFQVNISGHDKDAPRK